MVKYGETVVVAWVDTDGDGIAGNVVNLEGPVISEIVFKARLLAKLSKVTVCLAESDEIANPLPEETKAMAALEVWTESFECKEAVIVALLDTNRDGIAGNVINIEGLVTSTI